MKKIIPIIVICLLLFVITGCTQYDYLGHSEEKGNMIDIGGVLYRSLPKTLWRPNAGDSVLIGYFRYVDGEKINLYAFTADTKHMLLWDDPPGMERIRTYYYRDDIALPSYDSNGIDIIGFIGREENKLSNVTDNKDTIEKLFNLKKNAPREEMAGVGVGGFSTIQCMNSDFQGIAIDASVCLKDNKYWVEFGDEWYYGYEISQDLLEEIAGKKLLAPEELRRQWDAED